MNKYVLFNYNSILIMFYNIRILTVVEGTYGMFTRQQSILFMLYLEFNIRFLSINVKIKFINDWQSQHTPVFPPLSIVNSPTPTAHAEGLYTAYSL